MTGIASAPISITVLPGGAATAALSITVQTVTGQASLPVRVEIFPRAAATAPITVGIVDDLATTRWSARVVLDGADVSAQLTGRLSVEIEEGAARVAEFTLRPSTGAVDPLAWSGRTVAIDLLRVANGSSIPARLFTGRVDIARYDPIRREVAFACSDDLQNVVAALTRAQIDSLAAGTWSAACHPEPRDNWEYAGQRMTSRAASLDAGPWANPRVTPWEGLATWRTFTAADLLDGDLGIELPRRAELVNRVTATLQYRYFRLRERIAYIAWSMSWISNEAVATGFEFPDQATILGAVGGAGWLPEQHVFWPAPSAIAYGGGSVKPPAGSISAYQGRFRLRYAQPVTETYTLTVAAPASEAAHGTLGRETRGTLATSWSPSAWESSLAAEPVITSDQDYAPDATRAEAETALQCLLDMAEATILGSHRRARVSFVVPCLPEIDVDRAAAVDTATLDAEGKVYAVRHELDLDSGQAVTRVTLALSGVAAGGLAVLPSTLTPPAAPDLDAQTGSDTYAITAHTVHTPAAGAYSEALMGWLVNTPEKIMVEDVPDGLGGTVTEYQDNPYYTATAWPIQGFRASLPGVADSHRAPVELASAASYDLEIPEDALTLTA